jgi:hypothetical protein
MYPFFPLNDLGMLRLFWIIMSDVMCFSFNGFSLVDSEMVVVILELASLVDCSLLSSFGCCQNA